MNLRKKITHIQKSTLLFSFFILLFISSCGQSLFFRVQENAYQRPNELAFLNAWLNNQTSLTSLFGGMMYMSIFLIMGMLILYILGINWYYPYLSCLSLGLIAIGITYSWTEWQQSLNPPYPDNHLLDSILAWIGVATSLGITWLVPRWAQNYIPNSTNEISLSSTAIPYWSVAVFVLVFTILAGGFDYYINGAEALPWFSGLLITIIISSILSILYKNRKIIFLTFGSMVVGLGIVYWLISPFFI